MFCIYHMDLDGECSAALVYHLANIAEGERKEFCGMTYKDEAPLDKIEKDEEVWIVDFHLKPDDLVKLLEITKNVIWIDHHVSAIDEYNKEIKSQGIELEGLRKGTKFAGCMLTWLYIEQKALRERGRSERSTGDLDLMSQHAPLAVKLISDYDAWQWKLGKRTLHFYLGASALKTSPTAKIWRNVFRDDSSTRKIIEDGAIISTYKDTFNKECLEAWGFETDINGVKAYALNLPRCSSLAFGDKIDKYPVCISFVWDGDCFTFSLYSTQVDVSKICKSFGGGGHKGAAGFTSVEPPDFLKLGVAKK